MVSEWVSVVVGRDETVGDGASVTRDLASEAVRGGKQPSGLTQRQRLGIGTQFVAEGGMLGEQGRGADAQGRLEQRQGGELWRSGKQAMVEVRRFGMGGRHGQRFRVGELAAFFVAGCAKASR
jgi:hypothetical protein